MVFKLPTTDESTLSKWHKTVRDHMSCLLPWLSILLFKPLVSKNMLQSYGCAINP